MNLTQSVELTRRYQRQVNTVGANSATMLSRAWDNLGSWDEANVPAFAEAAMPIVRAAQQRAAALTTGYLGLLLGKKMPTVDASRFAASVDPRSPFLGYWASLSRGDGWEQAITLGRTRAETLGLDGVTTAARGTSSEIDDQEDRITGWERVPAGVCCDWCAEVSTQQYHSADSADFGHDRCNCGVVPIIGKVAPGRVINRPLLDNLKNISPDDRTGYVTASGDPAARPAPALVEAP